MKSDFWDTSALLALQCAADDFHAAAESVFDGRCRAARRSRAEFYCAATGRMGQGHEGATSALAIALSLSEHRHRAGNCGKSPREFTAK